MTDSLTKAKRSWNMSRIRSTDTKPELIVRSLLHRMGYRFRLHGRALPGKPDIVLPKYKTAIFVHGCFWHQHKGCRRCTTPSSNQSYWLPKLQRNVQKDKENQKKLKSLGWHPIVVWECQVKKTEKLAGKLRKIIQG